MKQTYGKIGQTILVLLSGVSRLWGLGTKVAGYFVASLVRPKILPRESFFKQTVLMGLDSTAIVSLVGASVGTVLALQAAYALKSFGAVMYTGSLVGVAMTRELGPLIASIVIWTIDLDAPAPWN